MSNVAEALGDNPRHADVAEDIFGHQFWQGEPSATHKYYHDISRDLATCWMGSEVVQHIEELGQQAAQQFRADRIVRGEAVDRASRKLFPRALKDRDPQTTPIIVLPVDVPLHASEDKYDGTFVNPLVRVLKDPKGYGFIRYDRENRLAELAADNIRFMEIDDSYFEVVEDRPYHKKLRIDTLSEDEAIELFGLNAEDHGDAEIVLVYDLQSRHGLAKLAEAVRLRVGKYPHIVDEQPPMELGVDHARWQVYEYVSIPPNPGRRPTLQNYLAQLASTSAMHESV